jgi:RNA polymerase sigma factor (TIGR02999 family)
MPTAREKRAGVRRNQVMAGWRQPIIGPNHRPFVPHDQQPVWRSLEMSAVPSGSVSQLLRAWGRGDAQARDDLVPLVYQELRRRASAYLRRERPDHTLQPTALVHEAYIRLMAQRRVSWVNRAQFFALAAQLMRRILVDHARERHAAKRPGGIRVTFDETVRAVPAPDCEVLMLDEALRALTRLDARQAEIVELKYFAGLSEAEIAAVLSLSRATVTREWQSARAWLYRRITKGPNARP